MRPSRATLPLLFWLAGIACQPATARSVGGPATTAPSQHPQPLRAAERRLVKRFDFDERHLGNNEDVPMHWLAYRAPGFPHFLEGRFDMQVGHEAAPSFMLALQGRSLAYYYQWRDIPAKPGSDYLIVGWVKPDRLDYARAYISAYFLDRQGRKLPHSERFSQMVGGPGQPATWQKLVVDLPGRFDRARFIGLQLWLVQPEIWQRQRAEDWAIQRQTIHGRAWFDDLTVYRLPRVQLGTPAAGNVLTASAPARLLANVNDPDGRAVTACLQIRAGDGRLVLSRNVPVRSLRIPQPFAVDLDRLEPGLYHARLMVSSGRVLLVQRQLDVARLARLDPRAGSGQNFGLNLTTLPSQGIEAVVALSRLLGPRRVRLPIWRRQGPTRHVGSDQPLARLLRALIAAQMELVATLAEPPAPAGRPRPTNAQPSLLDLFSDQPQRWQPHLALLVARYADVIDYWQIGQDHDDYLVWDPRLPTVLQQVRTEVAKLVTSPSLVSAWSATHLLPASSLDVPYLSLYVPSAVAPQQIPAQLEPFRGRGRRLWVSLELLDPRQYHRLSRLADLAKRLVLARVGGAETVFIDQPWRWTVRSGKADLEPTEPFLVFRTLATLLGGSQPAGQIYLDRHVRCYIFDHGSDSTLVVWDEREGSAPRQYRLYLGPQARLVDLWGRSRPLARCDDGRQLLPVTALPVLIDRVESWIARLRASLSITPKTIESSYRLHPAQLRFTNHRQESISGRVELLAPDRWQVRPSQMRFALRPGQTLQRDLTIRFPYSELAGPKLLRARLLIDADRTYELFVSIPLELRLPDIDVQTIAQVADGRLIVRQRITNLGTDIVNFRAALIAPGRPPQRRPVSALAPGQSAVKLYVFGNAPELMGTSIRASLEEVGGPRIFNQLIHIR